MTNKKGIMKTLWLYMVYQIVFLAGHMIIHNTVYWQMQSSASFVFTIALFTALVCVTKPTVISALCMVLTQILFYLLMVCHPNIDGSFLIYRVMPGSGFMFNFDIYGESLIIIFFKLACETIIFVLCAVVFAIIKRIKKSKLDRQTEANQE